MQTMRDKERCAQMVLQISDLPFYFYLRFKVLIKGKELTRRNLDECPFLWKAFSC